jgi:hypothetical protein
MWKRADADACLADAIVPILRAQVVARQDRGRDGADRRSSSLLVRRQGDPREMPGPADAEAMQCVSLINRVFDGVKGTRRAVHLCRHNKGRRGWVVDTTRGCRRSRPSTSISYDDGVHDPAAGDTARSPESVGIELGCGLPRRVIDEREKIVASSRRWFTSTSAASPRARRGCALARLGASRSARPMPSSRTWCGCGAPALEARP